MFGPQVCRSFRYLVGDFKGGQSCGVKQDGFVLLGNLSFAFSEGQDKHFKQGDGGGDALGLAAVDREMTGLTIW